MQNLKKKKGPHFAEGKRLQVKRSYSRFEMPSKQAENLMKKRVAKNGCSKKMLSSGALTRDVASWRRFLTPARILVLPNNPPV